MQITPFIKAVGDAMPSFLGIQSYTMSLLYLGVYLPIELYEAGENRAFQTPIRGREFNPNDHSIQKQQLQWDCRAHALNLGGSTAFLYFTHPWGLIAGYILWTGHYMAKLEGKMLEQDPSIQDRLWITLYSFGAITCIFCALFSHQAIPITVAIVAARVFATTLSSIETSIFFYTLSQKTFFAIQQGVETASQFMTPRKAVRITT